MRNALVIRHVSFEDLGTLAGCLNDHGFDFSYIDAGRKPLPLTQMSTADLLIILGGPISANDENIYPFLTQLRQTAARRIKHQQPTLGVCLGAQIMARACNAAVSANPQKEIGWSSIELTVAGRKSCLRHLQDTPVLHWHGETFAIPEPAVHLAQTAICRNQAFQIGPNILGLQFHPEAAASSLESWYIGHTLELTQADIDINELRAQSQHRTAQLEESANACFGEWLQQLQLQ